MKDKLTITFPDGHTKEIILPKYGEVKIIVRKEKITDIDTINKEKIC